MAPAWIQHHDDAPDVENPAERFTGEELEEGFCSYGLCLQAWQMGEFINRGTVFWYRSMSQSVTCTLPTWQHRICDETLLYLTARTRITCVCASSSEQLDCPIEAVLPMVEGGCAEKGKINLILLKAVTSSNGQPAEDVSRAVNPYVLDIWAPDYTPKNPLVRIVFALDVP
ncbi:uncharacterized protein B0H18DRAFT_959724 [Fomitopsis serialis]|uniref:uncharacterized protein n=1 Tax=Fomitopsis serialis TaxID=139415 RepID=UPI0020077225|nr:uncharacterized protein B0H18DRAFT_959724 [Neoantrodia serialis]KAH9914594.1 hypothetical protein B0H18DRAFT_959724 [Neoantrodia serialis]